MEATLVLGPPADPEALHRLRSQLGQLPERYVSFLAGSNGGEGDLGVDPGWFVVWPIEEAAVASAEYEVPTYLPGYFAFGGNGGGELFVFELAGGGEDRPVFMVPAIGMSATELRPVSKSFEEFESQMGKVAPDAVA
jgi:hypothetical protein